MEEKGARRLALNKRAYANADQSLGKDFEEWENEGQVEPTS